MATVNRPNKVILHCSATPNYKGVTVEEIDSWHKARGWTGIGYHYVIYTGGRVVPGRAENVVGAHCKGKNTNSLGVCLIGTDRFSEQQVDSLIELYDDFYRRYGITPEAWHGHYQFDKNKTCPGIDMHFVRKLFEQRKVMTEAVDSLS